MAGDMDRKELESDSYLRGAAKSRHESGLQLVVGLYGFRVWGLGSIEQWGVGRPWLTGYLNDRVGSEGSAEPIFGIWSIHVARLLVRRLTCATQILSSVQRCG